VFSDLAGETARGQCPGAVQTLFIVAQTDVTEPMKDTRKRKYQEDLWVRFSNS
jgi:hypothetical protein